MAERGEEGHRGEPGAHRKPSSPRKALDFRAGKKKHKPPVALALGKENTTIKQYMRRRKINCIYILAFISKHSTKQS